MQSEDKAWIEHRNRFSEIYDVANYSSSLQSTVMRASHRLIEKAFDTESAFENVLEVGAGTGEHLPFVRHKFKTYIVSDMDPKTIDFARRKISQQYSGRIEFEIQTGDKLSSPDNTFDRLIATHVLEHIYQPHLALKEWTRVIKPGGVLSVLIPTDPGLAWRLGRHLGPRKNAVAQGIAYDFVMAREHVNSCNNLIAILRHYFPESTESWWPLPISSIDLNLFFAFHATITKNRPA